MSWPGLSRPPWYECAMLRKGVRMTPSTTLTIRVDRSVKNRLEKLAKSTGRTQSFLAAEALRDYLDVNEWQVAGIRRAIASLDAGLGVPHSEVEEWVKSWGSGDERPVPDAHEGMRPVWSPEAVEDLPIAACLHWRGQPRRGGAHRASHPFVMSKRFCPGTEHGTPRPRSRHLRTGRSADALHRAVPHSGANDSGPSRLSQRASMA